MNSLLQPWAIAALVFLLWCPRALAKYSTISTGSSKNSDNQALSSSCLLVKDVARKQDILMEKWGNNAMRVRAVPAENQFRDDLVSALVDKSTFSTSTHNNNGHACITVELSPNQDNERQSLESGNLRGTLTENGRLEFTNIAEDRIILTEIKPRQFLSTDDDFYGLNVTWDSPTDERLYGLGQHKLDALNYKTLAPLELVLAPRNTEILIPVIHSSRKYASLMNLPSFGTVTVNKESVDWSFQTVLQFDMWIATTAAENPRESPAVSPWAQLQTAYANATGYAPVYPYWTTGFWQSKNRYRNQTQLLDVARGYVHRGYPLALMVIDYYSWEDPSGQTHLGDEVLPKSCWPDPRAMVKELRDMGVELMVSPYFHSISPQSKYFAAAKSQKLLATNASGQPIISGFDTTYLYDLYQPETRSFAWRNVEKGFLQYGMHQNWWVDCEEPCYYRNSLAFEQTLVYNNGAWPASFVGAAYPHVVDQMIWEGQKRQDKKENSPVILGRSAWAGSQRFGGAVWSGDTESDFDNLRQQLRAGLNMGMSGIPYWTTDIGGYHGGNIDNSRFRQLLVRWFQYSAFCPFFRNHGVRKANHIDAKDECGDTNGSNELWNFGEEAEGAIAIMMRIREQLRPYVMEQYRSASERAEPIIRPLFYDFWKDDEAATVEDQFMFGPDYMIAPQLFENATNRTVYLPPGEVWVDYFSDGPYIYDTTNKTKGIRVIIPTPLEKFPVFIRAPTAYETKVSETLPQLLRGISNGQFSKRFV